MDEPMKKILFILGCLLISPLTLAQDDALTPYEIALERILEAERTGATYLDLSGLQLTKLPPEIGNLTLITRLHLSDNQLTTLPSEIGNLINLQLLYITENQLTNLPPEIGKLYNMEILVLNHNVLESLPPEIGNLNNLCHLGLASNNLWHLPTEMGNLETLTQQKSYCILNLDDNPLTPPAEITWQGIPAILDYIQNQALWHLQKLIASVATGFGIVALLILGVRWRTRRTHRKSKRKNDAI
jgi:Leucine-rich repeat (LRR) protein